MGSILRLCGNSRTQTSVAAACVLTAPSLNVTGWRSATITLFWGNCQTSYMPHSNQFTLYRLNGLAEMYIVGQIPTHGPPEKILSMRRTQSPISNSADCLRARLTRLTIELSRALDSTMRNPIRFDFSLTKVYTCSLIIQS